MDVLKINDDDDDDEKGHLSIFPWPTRRLELLLQIIKKICIYKII